jgi:hypothetical protein
MAAPSTSPPGNRLSRPTAEFLLGMLNTQQLNVGAPDFDQVVALVIAARAELTAIIEQTLPNKSD